MSPRGEGVRVMVAALHLDDPRVEAHVRRLVDGLWRRGHSVWIWSPVPGPASRRINRSNVKVFQDIDGIPDLRLDVIQAMHGPAAVIARDRFPLLPMVFCCVGIGPDELPPSIDVNLQAVAVLGEEARRGLDHLGKLPEVHTFLDPTRDPSRRLMALYRHARSAFAQRPLAGPLPVGEVTAAVERLREEAMSRDRGSLVLREDEESGTVLTAPLGRARSLLNRVAPWGTRRRSFILAPVRALRMLRREGPGAVLLHALKPWIWIPNLFRRRRAAVAPSQWDERYALWARKVHLPRRRMRALSREAAALKYRPTISIVMPTYDSDPRFLSEAVGSVRRQAYDRWELCIADDGSTREDTRHVLEGLRSDPRVKLEFLPENLGIAGASQAALELATGEFVALLDHDDELKPDALLEVAKAINANADVDYIYTDEDEKDEDGNLVEAFFKPDWSPDLLLSTNYTAHLSVFRRTLLEEVGGFRRGFDGSQDYDLILRVTEATDRIFHLPLPLYSWRKVPGSAASSLDYKDYAYEAGRRALEEALARRRIDATVEPGLHPGRYRVRYALGGREKVKIVIPTRDRLELLQRCVESVRSRTTYGSYDIMIVDNDSRNPDTLAYLDSAETEVIRYPGAFHYARMMNHAVERCGDADYVLFLNNDTEVISEDWLTAMLEHAQRQEVAAVGARLLHPDGRPQHEGIILGHLGGVAANVDHRGYFFLGETIRNCSAVTGACMLVRRERFNELGGFDERLGVVYNDVDLCLRAREKGYLIVYTPYAVLYHAESSTRKDLHPVEEERFFLERWGDRGSYVDPYYNPNLDPLEPFTVKLD